MKTSSQKVKGFYGKINGEDVVVFVAKEPHGSIKAGEVVTGYKLTQQQIKNWGLK